MVDHVSLEDIHEIFYFYPDNLLLFIILEMSESVQSDKKQTANCIFWTPKIGMVDCIYFVMLPTCSKLGLGISSTIQYFGTN